MFIATGRMGWFRETYQEELRKTTEVFEDCICYPEEQIVGVYREYRRILERVKDAGDDEIEQCMRAFAKSRDSLKKRADAPERIYLWEEGKMPSNTAYTDNGRFSFNHDPDFAPYFLEMLLPAERKPRGAVILCAGGDHGDTVIFETFQSGKEWNDLEYQCFILLNRTNACPWTGEDAGADAARCIRHVRANAETYRISPDQIVFAGFSNGGITGEKCIEFYSGAQTVKAVYPNYTPDALDAVCGGPDAFLCIYGPRFKGTDFKYENAVYPPVFFAVGRDDSAMENLNAVYPDLLAHHVPVEIHTFAGTPHGPASTRIVEGAARHSNFELWPVLADVFIQNVFETRKTYILTS